jgi:tetratricopeptide (TPR) repeat protein
MDNPDARPTFREVHDALRASQFEWLENTYAGLQRDYENSRLSDESLIDAFEVFGSGFRSVGEGCARWLGEKPDSYAAHVALATWLMNKGFDERGTSSAANVSIRGWVGLESLTGQATDLLTRSVDRTRRPLASYCLLGRIDWVAGDCRDPEDPPPDWYVQALTCDPDSFAARRVRLQSMQPHWGGSESQMLEFVNDLAQVNHRNQLLHCHHRWMGFYEGSWGEDAEASDAHFAEARRLDPMNKWTHLHQARAHYGLDRHDEAMASHRSSIQAMPEWAESYEELYNMLPDEDEYLAEALDLIERGIGAGSLELMKLRCTLYRDGNYGVTPNPKKTVEFGLQAYDEGCLASGNIVVNTLYSGGSKVNDPTVVDRTRALEMAEVLAVAGHPYTHYWMYNRRNEGEYPNMTDVEAASHLEIAAYGGVAPAAYFLAREISKGTVHYEGDDLAAGPAATAADRDAQVTHWFLWSAQLGDSDAMIRLAYIFVDGNDGTEADFDRALQWAMLAQEDGNSDAAAAIGYVEEAVLRHENAATALAEPASTATGLLRRFRKS